MIQISEKTAQLCLQALAELPLKISADAFNEIMVALKAALAAPPPAA